MGWGGPMSPPGNLMGMMGGGMMDPMGGGGGYHEENDYCTGGGMGIGAFRTTASPACCWCTAWSRPTGTVLASSTCSASMATSTRFSL